MAQSMSRAGNCYDNAMMESLWATLKKELVHDRTRRRPRRSSNGSRSGTSERGSTAHSATSAPRHSRRPRGPDTIIMHVRGSGVGPQGRVSADFSTLVKVRECPINHKLLVETFCISARTFRTSMYIQILWHLSLLRGKGNLCFQRSEAMAKFKGNRRTVICGSITRFKT